MQTKRIIIITLLISIVLNFLIPISLAENLADVEKPNINVDSLKIDKSEATIGDTITISIEITDNKAIRYAYIYYETPITKKDKSYKLTKNNSTGKYETKITIDENYEEGLWKITYITAKDDASNIQDVNNSNGKYGNLTPKEDLSKGDFTVTGTNADTEAPNINIDSIKIDKTEATIGDTVTVSLEITDNKAIRYAYIYYETPITKKDKSYKLTKNNSTGKYETKITIDENYEEGLWKITYITAKDDDSNIRDVNNSNGKYGNLTPKEDLSKANFMVYIDNETFENYNELKNIKTVDGVTVYKSNTTVSNQIINGDVYIGPEAVVTLSDVVVNGNIYILGGARLNSIIAKEVNARSIQWSSYGYTFYNGTAYISGNCSVNSMTSSTYPVQEIPYTIDNNEINTENGLLNMKGATLDIADFYINDQKIDLSDDGKFIIKNMKVNNKDKVTLKWVTVFGNTITKDIKILKNISLPTNYSVTIGHKKEMQLSQSPSDALLPDNINWESSNKDVATVDENGIIEAKSIGETIITAKTQNGKTASCNLKVINYLLGDVNKDGKITLADYTKILAHVKKTKLLTEEEQKRADVNQDGKVTLADYTKVLAHVKKTKMLE